MMSTHKVGEGSERTVWRHSRRDDRVIKVMKPSAKFNRNKSELNWFRRQDPIAREHLPILYDFSDGEFGQGLECEFIRDTNGQPSKNLIEHVKNGILSRVEADHLLSAFYDWAIRNHILISDSNLENILYQRHGRKRLVIVDGFGPGHTIYWSVVKRFPFLIRYSNERKRRRALRSLAQIKVKRAPKVKVAA